MSKKLIYLVSVVLLLSLVGSASAALPPGWSDKDINTAGGRASEINGRWTIRGDGADIWGSSDAFHFAYMPLSGDGQIIARVVNRGYGSNGWAKGGVMIRETLAPGSKHAMMVVTGGEGNGKAFQCRPITGSGSLSSHGGTRVSPPIWIKLTREGNLFTGHFSRDGVTWERQPDGTGGDMTPVPVEIYMATDVYIGLCVTSHAGGELRTYTFDNVYTEPPVMEGDMASTPNIYYVDADAIGANDGSSWADAYQYLQNALAAARYGDEIRVAKGTYKPDQRVVITARGTRVRSSGDRTETFQLVNGVAVKGGYGGFDEPDPDARDIEVYKTILSGDLNGNDSLNLVNNTENSYHVVTGSGTDETAVLDGFTITAGNANGTDWESQGGGIFNKSGSPTVTNCTFENNSATRSGGGMSNYNSSPTLTNCVFSRNSTNNSGGGILCHGASSPTITKCIISENIADYWGGGIDCRDSSPTIIDCTISRNAASVAPYSATGGGGINCIDSSPTIINCTISGNTTTTGGGIGCMRSSPTITNCTISNNTSTSSDGGIGCYWNSSPTITNCIISGNTAGYRGGGINCHESSSPIITNCIIVGNAANRGGGIRCYSSSPIITNCTFSVNWAYSRGGGMFNDSSSPTLTNCILWGDTPEEIYGGRPVITYSDVQGGWPGEGNIDINPLFVEAANGDYHLQASSPCIEAGDNSAVPEGVVEDLEGNPRIIYGIVDLGAIEGGEELRYAFNPEPADGAKYVDPNVELSWSSGFGAQLHIVYFGDNFDDVNIDAGGILQETTTYTPGPLELDKVYYWRVDEFDGVVIHKGDVWSFTVSP